MSEQEHVEDRFSVGGKLESRREFLKKAGLGTAAVGALWAVPQVTSMQPRSYLAASTQPPVCNDRIADPGSADTGLAVYNWFYTDGRILIESELPGADPEPGISGANYHILHIWRKSECSPADTSDQSSGVHVASDLAYPGWPVPPPGETIADILGEVWAYQIFGFNNSDILVGKSPCFCFTVQNR